MKTVGGCILCFSFWACVWEAHALPLPIGFVPNLAFYFYFCAGVSAFVAGTLLKKE